MASNFKILNLVEFKPDRDVVKVTGLNGNGKTTVLDAVRDALAGGRTLPTAPIRRGAEKAEIRLELGEGEVLEYVVRRRFTAKDSTVIIETPEGARYRSPQDFLDKLFQVLTFDPLKFMAVKPQEQFEELRKLLKLSEDLDRLDGLYRRDYETRTDENREAEKLRTQAAAIAFPEDLPAKPIDIAALMARLAAAAGTNAARTAALAEREGWRRDREAARGTEADQARILIADCDRIDQALAADVAEINRQIAELTARRENARSAAATAKEQTRRDCERRAEEAATLAAEFSAKLDNAPEVEAEVDTAALVDEMEKGRTTNAHIEARIKRSVLEAEAAGRERRSKELTDALADYRSRKAAAIAAAAMPVEGLSIYDVPVVDKEGRETGREQGILYKGLPLDQASHAEQIRISASIAMAQNPRLRIMLVRNPPWLDPTSMAALTEIVKAHDFQLWIEQPPDGVSGIELRDGTIIEHEPVAATPAAAPDLLV